MSGNSDSSVRIGSISIFALVIVLCVAVMGMLSVSTGHAALAASEKQAIYTSEMYQNEKEAWQFVSDIDKALYELKSGWWWSKSQGIEVAREIVESVEDASIDNDVIEATFTSENGKTLTLSMTISDDLQLVIDEWKVSTDRDTNTGDVFWSGE